MPKKEYTFPWKMEHWADFAEKLKDLFNGKTIGDRLREVLIGTMFVIIEDEQDKCKRVFRNKKDADTWFKAREDKVMTPAIAALEFAGATIPGTEQYKLTFNVLTLDEAGTYGSPAMLRFTFSTADTLNGNSPTEEPIEIFFTFSSDAGTKQISKIFPYTEAVTEFDITEYLEPDVNDITLLVRGRTSGLQLTTRATYNAVYLPFSSNFDITSERREGINFGIPYSISGIGQKEVEFLIDSSIRFNDSVYEGTANKTYSYRNVLEPGLHTLQMKAYTTVNGKTFESNMLFFEFVVSGEGLELTTTVVKAEFPSGTPYFMDRKPGLIGEQYVDYLLQWAYFSTSQPNATVMWKTRLNGIETIVGSREIDEMEGTVGVMPDPVKFQPDTVGIYDLYAYIKGDEAHPIGQYTINVKENSAGLREAEDYIMKLNAKGRSNNEPADTLHDWSNNGFKTTFNDRMTFDGLAGYTGDAVRFDNGAQGINDCKPFATERGVLANGAAISLHFRTFNVEDENAPLIRIGDPSNPYAASLAVYGKKVILRPSNGAALTYEFASEEDTHLAIVVHPKTGVTDAQMMFFIFNGIEAPGAKYSDTAVFNIGSTSDKDDQNGMIVMGDATGKAAIDIYGIRVYNSMLSMWQGMNNYMIDHGGDVAKMMRKNDLFQNNDFAKPVINKIREQYRVLEIIGDLGMLETSSKKENFFGSCRYTDPFNPKFNFERLDGGAYIETAGQSRLEDLMAKSFHLDLNQNDTVATYQDGKLTYKNRFIFADGNIPENGVRIDLSGADSSICRNASHMKMVNKYYPYITVDGEYVLRTPPQRYALSGKWSQDMAAAFGGDSKDYPWSHNINFAPDSVPVVVVWHKQENDPIQVYGLAQMTEEKKASYANGNHSIYIKAPLSDGTYDPFDRYSGTKGNRGWDNDGVIEVEYVNPTDLTNNIQIYDFYDETLRDYSFELCFPKNKDLIDGGAEVWSIFLNEFLAPITATNGDQMAFDANIENIIYMPSFAMYYNKCLDKKCNDSLCRNMHVIRYNMGTATSPKWLWWAKWWDVDVCCGLFQSNAMGVDPETDRQTKDDNGKYVMAGHDMWLWNALEQNETFQSWCRKLAESSYAAGWSARTEKAEQDLITDAYSEALYNLDGLIKFLNAFRKGNDYMIRMQGSSVPYRHGFIDASYAVRESLMAIGSYAANSVSFRADGATAPAEVRITAASRWRFGIGTTTTAIVTGLEKTPEDGEFSIPLPSSITLGRDFLSIYGADKIRTLDVSDFTKYQSVQINLGNLRQVQRLWIGYRSHEQMARLGINQSSEVSFTNISAMTRVTKLSIMGLHGVTSFDLSALNHLTTFTASASGLLNFVPADGTKFQTVELPDTLQTIECRNVSLGDVSFWQADLATSSVSLIDTCPTSLLVLSLVGMGTDAGAHMVLHRWYQMLRQHPELINSAQITYRALEWHDVDKADIITLSRIPKAQRNLTGYVFCTETFNAAERTILTEAFGTGVFDYGERSNTLVCDCQGDGISISAVGDTLTAISESSFRAEQGNAIQFTGAGFPISGSSRKDYRWRVWVNGTWLSGSPSNPTMRFGSCTLNWLTGAFSSDEDAREEITYRIGCYDMNNPEMRGEVELTVAPRSYPERVDVSMIDGDAFPDEHGRLTITELGSYRFRADHMPSGFTGRMIEDTSSFWSLAGSDYNATLEVRRTADTITLDVFDMPTDDLLLSIGYTSVWRNGLSLTATSVPISIVTVVAHLLNSDFDLGNPVLYHCMQALGIAPEAGWYSNMHLKQPIGKFSVRELVPDETKDLKHLMSGEYYIPQYLKNVTQFDFSNTALEDTFDVNKTPQATSINLEGTYASIIF